MVIFFMKANIPIFFPEMSLIHSLYILSTWASGMPAFLLNKVDTSASKYPNSIVKSSVQNCFDAKV